MAGIYARGETDDDPVTFAILTTKANDLMAPIPALLHGGRRPVHSGHHRGRVATAELARFQAWQWVRVALLAAHRGDVYRFAIARGRLELVDGAPTIVRDLPPSSRLASQQAKAYYSESYA